MVKIEVTDEFIVLGSPEDEYNGEYAIPLESFTSCAQMLDWIFQLSQKTWMTDKDLGRFVRKLNETFYPQAHYCSFGRDRGKVNPMEIIPKVARENAELRKWRGVGFYSGTEVMKSTDVKEKE